MKKKATLIIAGILICGIVCVATGCASSRRFWKSVSSDMANGLNRTVTVYDYDGKPIKEYSGKFDVSESENEVYFDINGKRVIIHGGIVINEEN